MRQSTVVLLTLLAITLFAAWFFTTHHKVIDEEYVGYSGEARYNPFLAAEILLKEAGIAADARSSLTPSDWLPDYEDTIVTHASESIAVIDDRSYLFDWIIGGGHLVILPPKQDSTITDEFISSIGAKLVKVEHDEHEDDEEVEDEPEDKEYDYSISLGSTDHRVEIADDDSFSATLSDEIGNVAVRRRWGSGYITLLADDEYFRNRSLANSDHARFLLDVVAGYVEPGKVWFILDSAFPSLWQLLWKNGFYVVVASALALLLWLWSVVPRFGPAIEPAIASRRSILEHVAAAGHFAWRHHGTVGLARSSIDALIHDAEIRHPGISRLSPDKQAQALARLSGLDAQKILDILLSHSESQHREFTSNIQDLQKLRKRL